MAEASQDQQDKGASTSSPRRRQTKKEIQWLQSQAVMNKIVRTKTK
jgi:hypothetical protein